MKTLRLVLPLIVLFFSTVVCGLSLDPDDWRDPQPVPPNMPVNPALQAATATASPVHVIISTNTFTPVPIPQSVLPSGSYEVDVLTGGKEYHSTWTLEVIGEVVTGSSTWTCCPSARTDPLSGTFIGEELTLERDCSGQGYVGRCTQIYKGTVKGNTITGTITQTGIPPSGATWTLYLSP